MYESEGQGVRLKTFQRITNEQNTMSWSSSARMLEASQRKREREIQKRVKELERRQKELNKLSELERAKLEVHAYENHLEALLSVHKVQSLEWNWEAVAAILPPPAPVRMRMQESQVRQRIAASLQSNKWDAGKKELQRAVFQDDQEYQSATTAYGEELSRWRKMKALAKRILQADPSAYVEALTELSPLADLSELGSSLHFAIHTATTMVCTVKINGVRVIPAESKTLTSSGKVSTKAIPKAKFHEYYQDHICGGVLRIAREVFALLPVKTVIVTAVADKIDDSTGAEEPVLSVVVYRMDLQGLDFETLDPSDTLEKFLLRSEFKATRKEGAFRQIVPFTPHDLESQPVETLPRETLLSKANDLREEIRSTIQLLQSRAKANS